MPSTNIQEAIQLPQQRVACASSYPGAPNAPKNDSFGAYVRTKCAKYSVERKENTSKHEERR